MVTTTSVFNLGPLTTTYTPSGASCNSIIQTNPGLILVYGTTDGASVSSCLPTNFNGNGNFYYSPGICPSGYDYACSAGLGDGGTAATCCPTGYVCRKGRVATDTGACQSTLLTDSSFTIMAYTPTDTSRLITDLYVAGNSVYAKGVVVRRDSDDPAWGASDSTTSTTTSTTKSTIKSTIESTATSSTIAAQTSSSSSGSGQSQTETDGGLSTGARAGIGVGVALGALLIIGVAVAAFLIGRRKRRAAQAENAARAYPPQDYHQHDYPHQDYPPQLYVHPYHKHPDGSEATRNNEGYRDVKPVELEVQRKYWELQGHSGLHAPIELEGS